MNNRICIDARLWGIGHTGIGRYVENLVTNLPVPDTNRIVLILHPNQKLEPGLQKYSRYYAQSHPYSLWSQFEMFFLLQKIGPALLHVPHFTIPVLWPGKIVVTIHDLIKHISVGPLTTTRSGSLYQIKYLLYLLIVRLAVCRASQIIVPANYWKEDLLRRYHLDQKKISVVYGGVATRFYNPSRISNPEINSLGTYIIYTGNLYPHKNVPVLLSAVKMLKGRVKLVIVCSRSVFLTRIQFLVSQMKLQQQVIFLGRVSDDKLVNLYHHSLAFVTASRIEGFGLPGLEAMAAGTPVIAANASCFPEIYGGAALYLDPEDPEQLAKIITGLLHNEKARQDLIISGKKQALGYSWQKMARQTWQIYQNALL